MLARPKNNLDPDLPCYLILRFSKTYFRLAISCFRECLSVYWIPCNLVDSILILVGATVFKR